jgi:hypothetical protein
MAGEAASAARPRRVRQLWFDRAITDRPRRPNPASPRVASFAAPGAYRAEAAPAEAPQVISPPHFTSVTLPESLFLPPDPMGVVGPRQFLTHVNGRVRSHDKATGTTGALDASVFAFWATVMEDTVNGFVTDPRVKFDRLTDRWFLLITDVPSNAGTNGNRTSRPPPSGPSTTSIRTS